MVETQKPKELEILEAIDVFCNFFPSRGGDDKDLLLKNIKPFNLEHLEATLEFMPFSRYEGDEKIESVLKKLMKAKGKKDDF